jgi:hypothetical protein
MASEYSVAVLRASALETQKCELRPLIYDTINNIIFQYRK